MNRLSLLPKIYIILVFILSYTCCEAQENNNKCYFQKDGYWVRIYPSKESKHSWNLSIDFWFFEKYPSFLKDVENPLDTLFLLGGQVVNFNYYSSAFLNAMSSDSIEEAWIEDVFFKYLQNSKEYTNKHGGFSFEIVPVKIIYFTKNMTLGEYFDRTKTSHTSSYLELSVNTGNVDVIYPELVIYYPHIDKYKK